MSEEKYGVENIKEVIKLVSTVVKKAVERFYDGVGVLDFIDIAKWIIKDETLHAEFKAAVKDAPMILKEAMDLSLSELLELYSMIKGEFSPLNIDFSGLMGLLKFFPCLKKFFK